MKKNSVKRRFIECGGQTVEYALKRYKRQRCIRLTLRCDGTLAVTAPWWVRVREVEAFVRERRAWIEKHIAQSSQKTYSDEEKRIYKRLSRERVESALRHINTIYGFSWNRVSIRDSRSQWGSCSEKKNLSFSLRVALLEDDLLEYIVAHELCHLKEMNHSPAFWNLVSLSISDYRERKEQLKRVRL